ncbi:hypothetical protein JW911_01775 [Candidatus Peregrinibacteria bacterium]|nr:hypothetical protein [Candidatus Peregrinibacteria bacterium]
MKKILLTCVFILVLTAAFSGCAKVAEENEKNNDIQATAITNFQECVDAGNPVMESYPRQCSANGKTFIEEISKPILPPNEPTDSNNTAASITEAEARVIAEANCIKGGEALGPGSYNPNSKTWWFDANLNATQPGCNPACVVYEETGETEINWRCTGLVLPEETES